MAAYSYKRVLHQIPEFIIKQYEKDTGCTYEMEAGYNGDGWSVTEMYIAFLEKELEDKNKTLNSLQEV